MKVTVKLDSALARAAGAKQIALELRNDQPTVRTVLDELCLRYPSLARELNDASEGFVPYSLLLEGELVRSAQVSETRVADGNELFIFVPIAGGSGQVSAVSGQPSAADT